MFLKPHEYACTKRDGLLNLEKKLKFETYVVYFGIKSFSGDLFYGSNLIFQRKYVEQFIKCYPNLIGIHIKCIWHKHQNC